MDIISQVIYLIPRGFCTLLCSRVLLYIYRLIIQRGIVENMRFGQSYRSPRCLPRYYLSLPEKTNIARYLLSRARGEMDEVPKKQCHVASSIPNYESRAFI